MSAGKETTDEKQAQHFGQSQNVTGVVVAPILGPYERAQLSIAVNATHQHGDPHSPPETRSDCPLQTRSKLRITCGRPWCTAWAAASRRLGPPKSRPTILSCVTLTVSSLPTSISRVSRGGDRRP